MTIFWKSSFNDIFYTETVVSFRFTQILIKAALVRIQKEINMVVKN